MSWEFSKYYGSPVYSVEDAEGNRVAEVGDRINARLIAAAPEMLAALEVIATEASFPTATHENIVRHAIAKAKGKAQ